MRPLNFPKANGKFQTIKTLLFGIVIGAVAVSLYLDNRFGAMIKAFQHPTQVNSAVFSMEVLKK